MKSEEQTMKSCKIHNRTCKMDKKVKLNCENRQKCKQSQKKRSNKSKKKMIKFRNMSSQRKFIKATKNYQNNSETPQTMSEQPKKVNCNNNVTKANKKH